MDDYERGIFHVSYDQVDLIDLSGQKDLEDMSEVLNLGMKIYDEKKTEEAKEQLNKWKHIVDIYMAEREEKKKEFEVSMVSTVPIMDSGAAGATCPKK